MQVDQKDIYNIQLATRQTEINEWTYDDKMDTLFVFQLIFLGIIFITILFYLYRIGIIGRGLIIYVSVVLGIVITLILISRAMHTNVSRDKRSWNRKNFDGDRSLKSPVGSSQEYVNEIKNAYGPQDFPPECPAVCPSK
jgi:hypothetical protein